MKSLTSLVAIPINKAIVVMVIGVMALVVAGALEGRKFLVEKLLVQLALPLGLLWVMLWFLAIWLWFDKRYRFAAVVLAMLAFFTLTTSGMFAAMISESLERPYSFVDVENCDTFDLVVVLGGGVKALSHTEIQTSSFGDRIVLAARLYHAGKAKKLLPTGSKFPWDEPQVPQQSGAAKTLLIELMVPEKSIEVLGGRNTYEEIQFLEQLLQESHGLKVGIVTSATHMPRVSRLAASCGIDFTPLPADFERTPYNSFILDLVPDSSSARRTSHTIKEFLAAVVSR